MKPDMSVFRKSVKKIKVSLKSAKNSGTLHKDMCTFMIISRRIPLRMKTFLGKHCTENQNTHFVLNKFFSKIKPFMR
jgi:hypothetical protein